MTDSDFDVLVLGAGAAGLMAARALADGGARVAVIEARSRTGGRILTEHAGMPLELGAEFIHGLPPVTWQLLREAGLSAQERQGAHLRFVDGRLHNASEGPEGYSIIEEMQRWFAAQPPGTDLSFAQFLTQIVADEARQRAALMYVEGFNAAEAGRISVASLVEQQRAEDAIAGDRIFHLSAGYDSLPAYLGARLQQRGGELLLGSVVELVQWESGRVQFSGTGANHSRFNLYAKQAVITLPLGVLQSGNVRFSPTPGRVLALADELAMGVAMRFSLVFRSAFWQEASAGAGLQPPSFLFAPGLSPSTWWTPAPEPWPVLTGWIGGPRAQAARESWLERGLAALAAIFAIPLPKLRELLVSSHYHDWSADPLACGSYSYVPVGAMAASRAMALPVEQTLFFAGEHVDTAAEWGTVHGALRSGARAAEQVLRSR